MVVPVLVATVIYYQESKRTYRADFYQDEIKRAKLYYPKLLKALKTTIIVSIISTLFNIGIPSRSEIYTIVGGSIAHSIATDNKKELNKLPKNLLKATNSFLEGLEEEKPKEENK